MIKHVYSGSKWEEQASYSRAKRMGPCIAVSGTVAVDAAGKLVGPHDAYEQARFILQKIAKALAEADASLKDVIRTRLYLADMKDFEAVGRAHKEVFQGIDPATTAVAVGALVDPAMLVEIEADAYVER
ncbi:MAG: RidA family protein [Acidiferrobacter sp.]